MRIDPTYATLEQALWLKDRGFDNTDCTAYFHIAEYYTAGHIFCYSSCASKQEADTALAPEQWQVVEWLRGEHGVWVYSYPVAPFVTDDEPYPRIVWVSKICSLNQVNFERFVDADNGLAVNHHHSPQAAYSVAFDHIRNNNII